MKKIRSYTSIWSVEKVLYSINDFKLPFPITFTQMAWFVVSVFAVMLLGNLPPLSFIDGAFLKYFGVPFALTWFMCQKTFDGKKPYGFLKSVLAYVYGGDSPSTSFDCSGLVQWCYGKAGIALPRTAQEQYNVTQHIPLSEAKAGDLVFFHSTYNAGTYITHVGLYVGNNRMYHAGNPIGYADLTGSYWQQHLAGAGRIKQ